MVILFMLNELRHLGICNDDLLFPTNNPFLFPALHCYLQIFFALQALCFSDAPTDLVCDIFVGHKSQDLGLEFSILLALPNHGKLGIHIGEFACNLRKLQHILEMLK
jgi:hypothetical protein